MASFFNDSVQEIKAHYQSPMDQCILFLRGGHQEAASKLIDDYTMQYKEQLDSNMAAAEKSGKEFGAYDAVNTAIALGNTCLDPNRKVFTHIDDVKKMGVMYETTCEQYDQIIKEWTTQDMRRQTREQRGISETAERKQKFLDVEKEMLRLQNKVRVLEDFTVRAKKDCINDNAPSDSDNAIPSAGKCMVM